MHTPFSTTFPFLWRSHIPIIDSLTIIHFLCHLPLLPLFSSFSFAFCTQILAFMLIHHFASSPFHFTFLHSFTPSCMHHFHTNISPSSPFFPFLSFAFCAASPHAFHHIYTFCSFLLLSHTPFSSHITVIAFCLTMSRFSFITSHALTPSLPLSSLYYSIIFLLLFFFPFLFQIIFGGFVFNISPLSLYTCSILMYRIDIIHNFLTSETSVHFCYACIVLTNYIFLIFFFCFSLFPFRSRIELYTYPYCVYLSYF